MLVWRASAAFAHRSRRAARAGRPATGAARPMGKRSAWLSAEDQHTVGRYRDPGRRRHRVQRGAVGLDGSGSTVRPAGRVDFVVVGAEEQMPSPAMRKADGIIAQHRLVEADYHHDVVGTVAGAAQGHEHAVVVVHLERNRVIPFTTFLWFFDCSCGARRN